jgi:hypothetical protein
LQLPKTRIAAVLAVAVAVAVPLVACGDSSTGVDTGTPDASSPMGSDGGPTGQPSGTVPDGAPVGDAATSELRVTIVSDSSVVLAPGQNAIVRAVVDRGSATGPVTLRFVGLGGDYASKDARRLRPP